MSGGAIIIRRQSQAIRRFRDAGAMSPERARRFDEVVSERVVLNRYRSNTKA